MRAKDVFGIVLRTLGVIFLMMSALDASVAISMVTTTPANTFETSILVPRSIIFLVVGLLLLFGTKVIVHLTYDKED